MLDQNTDRMWYVIGAVLIGAAIIFGMNTLMPEAFASVGGMFGSISDSAMSNIDSILFSDESISQVKSLEDSFQQDDFHRGAIAADGRILDTDMWKNARIRHKDYHRIDLVESVEISFNAKDYQMGLHYFTKDKSKIMVPGGDWKTKGGTYDVPDGAYYIRVVLAPFDRDGNGNDRGISLNEFDMVNAQLRIVSERKQE